MRYPPRMSALTVIVLAVVVKVILHFASRRSGHENPSASCDEGDQDFEDARLRRAPDGDDVPLGNMGSEQYAAVAGSRSILDDVGDDIDHASRDNGGGDWSSSWSDDR
jgi:hypothetical protein